MRRVKGILFVDYVRMIRGMRTTDWSDWVDPRDATYLSGRIDPNEWYPMETFERLGNAILERVARGDMFAVRMWGRLSVDQLAEAQPMLVAPGEPLETLNRFRVLRSTYFDFDAIDVIMLHDGQAQIVIHYYMGNPAEEAASQQTMGFFERLLELAGAIEVEGTLRERSWDGDARTLLALSWTMPDDA